MTEPSSQGSRPIRAIMTTSTAGAMWIRKSLNVSPARLAMMMFGGSPTSVAAPPTLDAKTSATKNGVELTPSRSHTSSVTGAINNTVVTLSSRADPSAVTSTSRIMMRNGAAFARLTAQIATYSKTPVCRSTLTMIIMPKSRKMTSQSIPASCE